MSESVSQIYVVDDDLSVRESVGRLIKSAGLNVKTFPAAQEILANFKKGSAKLSGAGYPASRPRRL